MNDGSTRLLVLAVAALGGVALLGCSLAAAFGRPLPSELLAVGSVCVGALTGILATRRPPQ